MINPKHKFFLTVGSTTVEFFPNNFYKTKYTWTQEKDQIFFRKKLSGKINFINDKKNQIDDFDKLFKIFIDMDDTFGGASKCSEIIIDIQKLCGTSNYESEWQGKFSTGVCFFDRDACVCEIQPDVYDKYSCILSELDNEIDIRRPEYPLDFYETSQISGTMEYFREERLVDECDAGHNYVKCYKDNVLVSCGTFVDAEWCFYNILFFDSVCEFGSPNKYRRLTIRYYKREIINTPCINSCADPNPPDSSWTLLLDNCATILCEARWFRCGSTDARYNNLYLLNDVIELGLLVADCELEYSSIFFDRNPNVLDDFYLETNSGEDNYVTGNTSWTRYLMIAQKSDVKRPFASTPSQHGITSLKKILIWLRSMFNVYFDITDDGKFILEHVIYYRNNISAIDFRTFDATRNIKKNKFDQLKVNVPRTEVFTMMEGEYLDSGDFADNTITYPEACSDEGNSVSNSADEVTTNLEFISEWPDEIDESGFVMMATSSPDGLSFYLNFEAGKLSGVIRANAHLSWANLVYNYHRYDRYLNEGIMNGVTETFFTFKPNCKQVPLQVKHCCGDPAFDPTEQFYSELGQDHLPEVMGLVDSAEYSNGTEILSVTLKYAH